MSKTGIDWLDELIRKELIPFADPDGLTVYAEDALYVIQEAVRQALSRSGRITEADVEKLQRYKLWVRTDKTGGIEGATLAKSDAGPLVLFSDILSILSQPEQEWVRVDKELPKHGQKVWGKSDYPGMSRLEPCFYDANERGFFYDWVDDGGEVKFKSVAYWCEYTEPTPPPFTPNEEQDEHQM